MQAARLWIFLSLTMAGCIGLFGCEDPEPTPETDAGPDPGLDAGGEPACGADRLQWGRGGEYMQPGADCLGCHQEGGRASHVFTVGGTLFVSPDCPEGVEGATIRLTGSDGATLELVSNEVGNFRSAEELMFPVSVSVEIDGAVWEMTQTIDQGSCATSRCHTQDGRLGLAAPHSE